MIIFGINEEFTIEVPKDSIKTYYAQLGYYDSGNGLLYNDIPVIFVKGKPYTNEGIKIKQDLETRIHNIEEKIKGISSISTGLVQEYIVKLETRIKELLKTDVVDETRLAQEIVIFSDKCSIEEELTRLRSHIAQLYELLNQGSPIGKKIDFITPYLFLQ